MINDPVLSYLYMEVRKMKETKVSVIGAGLAGSEAAWQLAKRGIKVDLYEMRPVKPNASPSYR
jgi:folate-dependent tRNA-U54 methylase TrmFO/GidA